MRQHLEFLETSSAVVKFAAWIFLVLGLVGGIPIILGKVPGYPIWKGIVVLAIYAFFFFLFYLIAKIADLLVQIINEIKKDEAA
jgi:hypothetical protein